MCIFQNKFQSKQLPKRRKFDQSGHPAANLDHRVLLSPISALSHNFCFYGFLNKITQSKKSEELDQGPML
jgi:hypothetical protein